MVTDDERREVAERLRAYGKEFGDATWRELCNVVLYDEDRYPSTVRKLRLIDRLADLIDPSDTSHSRRDTVACDREAGESGHKSGQNRDTVQKESPAVQKAPECDREALLALADEMEAGANYDYEITHAKSAREQIRRIAYYASRIREACGEVVG